MLMIAGVFGVRLGKLPDIGEADRGVVARRSV
jgi:hypothetical protein